MTYSSKNNITFKIGQDGRITDSPMDDIKNAVKPYLADVENAPEEPVKLPPGMYDCVIDGEGFIIYPMMFGMLPRIRITCERPPVPPDRDCRNVLTPLGWK